VLTMPKLTFPSW